MDRPRPAWRALVVRGRAWTTLGALTRLTWIDAKGKEHARVFGLRSAPTLVYPTENDGHPIGIVYGRMTIRAATPEEVARYKKTHWGEEGLRRVIVGDVALQPFRVLGRGVMIQYTTKKGDEGGGKLVDWCHPWGEGGRGKTVAPQVVEHVCQNARCAAMGRLALAGGTYRVTERGIVG
jgi:hypothetical protein